MIGGLVLFCSCGKDTTVQESFEPSFSAPARVNKINAAGNGYVISIEASDDVSWNATVPSGSGNDWITLVSASGKGAGAMVFNLKANEERESRSINVTIAASSDRSPNFVPSQVCIINQIGTAPSIELYPADRVTVPTDANPGYAIAVTANVAWTASVEITSGPEGWISITSPGTPVSGEGEVKLDILENTVETPRVAIVTVVSTENPDLRKTLTITQSGIIPSIVISPAGTASITAAADNGYEVTVLSNIEWEASIVIAAGDEDGWITVATPEGAFTGNGSIILRIKANNSEAARTAVLYVKSIAHPEDNNLNKTLSITQINSGAKFIIAIPGYTVLTEGSATMNISPYPSGTPQDVQAEVTSDESGAIINFTDILPAGNYMLNSLAYDANPTVNIGAVFTINAIGVVAVVEHWDTHFNLFGGTYADRPIPVASTADLATLRDAVNDGKSYAGLYIRQTEEIALSGEWNPIGNASANPFAGIYDGNNKKIVNLYISSGTGKALFGNAGGVSADSVAVIKNLTIEGLGGDNADVTGDDGSTAAGIVAVVSANTLIENCTNRANIKVTAASSFVGGIAGTCTGDNIAIKECRNYGTIFGAAGINGGVVASMSSTADENIYVTSCHNYGDMDINSAGTSTTGGVVGRTTNPARAEIKWCSNRGTISLNGVNATNGTGGVIGSLLGNSVAQECYNLGTINTFTNTGGIAGFVNLAANNSRIVNCYNRGTILYTTRTAVNNGGISGNATNYWTVPIEYCYNAGATHPEPEAADRYGAIVGANTIPGGVLTAFTGVKECFYETGLGYVGGLGGNVPPGDVAGATEGKDAAGMKTATPYTANWDTNVWQFTAGQYPTLKNNPE